MNPLKLFKQRTIKRKIYLVSRDIKALKSKIGQNVAAKMGFAPPVQLMTVRDGKHIPITDAEAKMIVKELEIKIKLLEEKLK